jgi:protein-S-isoprenylcysteine O-methyltransferase Ste14
MNIRTTQTQTVNVGGILKRFVQVAVIALLYAGLLFLSAGRLDWIAAWVYLAVYAIVIGINSLILIPRNPDLLAERASPKENVKGWDKQISALSGVASLGALVVAGLDLRFNWSTGLPLAVQLAGLIFLVLGYALFSWAMVSNAFFSTLVRIQDDRGHAVAAGGPYRYVRHPGYVGWILLSLATPLLLGSLWALGPGGLSAFLMMVRTALEDKTLLQELPGYTEYARQVRFRLLPGVW